MTCAYCGGKGVIYLSHGYHADCKCRQPESLEAKVDRLESEMQTLRNRLILRNQAKKKPAG